jgi:hypothetical protein
MSKPGQKTGSVVRKPQLFGDRLIGAARLRPDVYEDVEADTSATPQAAIVVCLSAVSLAIGESRAGLTLVAYSIFRELVAWPLWSGITYIIGAKLLRGKATWGELLRTVGFAQAPGLLYALRAITILDSPVKYSVATWKLLAVIVAIRQALDFDETRWSNSKAVLTAGLGFVAYVSFALLEALLFGRAMAPPW